MRQMKDSASREQSQAGLNSAEAQPVFERKFKDSGIEWIGRIPEEWEVDVAKHVFRQRRDKGNEECQLLAATQKYGMYPQHLLEGVVKVAADTDLSQFKTVHKNDYVISLRSFQGGFEMSDYEGVCSPAYQVFYATRQISSQFYKYLFKSDAFIQEINSLTVGIREGKNILYDDFALLSIPIPAASDQQRIADYLDEKCGEIDSLIGLQEQMIEKLKAYKQSVITEAVTKGLNPNAKLVPSGIPFIGDVPEGWAIVPLRFLGRTQNGISKSGEYFGEGEPFVCYSDVYKNYSLPSKVTGLAKSTKQDQLLFSVEEGDVFFTRTSETIDEIGFSSVCLSTIEKAVFAGFLIRFRPYKNKLNKNFSKYYFRSSIHRAYFVKEMNLVTRASLSQELLKSMPVLLPPLDEQQAIATYLDNKCSEIDKLIDVKQQKIEKLKDYKKSVIYEAVTGKINIES